MADLEMYRGDDKTINLTFTNSAGSPIDLTSASIFFTVKKYSDDADASALISKKVTSHTQATGGLSSVTISDSDSNIAIGNYKFDIQLVDSAGSVTTVTTGSFSIKRDITIRTT
jgi:hypothetical protein